MNWSIGEPTSVCSSVASMCARRWLAYSTIRPADRLAAPSGHLLDHDSIRLIGAAQREHPVPVGGCDDERVDLARADRPQRLLRARQPREQRLLTLASANIVVLIGIAGMSGLDNMD